MFDRILFPFKWSVSRLFLVLIYFYRYIISPITPSSCRFYPTCSAYGLEAIKKHGPFLGGWLTIKRMLRCNPLFKAGYDPVPDLVSKCGKKTANKNADVHDAS